MFAVELAEEPDTLVLTSTDKSFSLRKCPNRVGYYENVKIHDVVLKKQLLTQYPQEKFVWPLFFELKRVQNRLTDPDIFNITIYDGNHIKLDDLHEWYSVFLFDRFEYHMYGCRKRL